MESRRKLAEEMMGDAATKPVKIRGLVAPQWRANMHPAAPLLRQYSTTGFPVDVGQDCTRVELEAAVKQGPHKSALADESISQMQVKTREKAAQGFAKIYTWEELKKSLPPTLKLPPLEMIPHKSRKYRAILDFSFELIFVGHILSSVNNATKKMAPM